MQQRKKGCLGTDTQHHQCTVTGWTVHVAVCKGEGNSLAEASVNCVKRSLCTRDCAPQSHKSWLSPEC
jgi:hypothetical protein